MSEKRPQTYANHVKWVPLFHYVAMPLLGINLVLALVGLLDGITVDALNRVGVAIGLMLALLFARVSALKAQDRVIRLEERLRMERLLPDDLKPRIDACRPRSASRSVSPATTSCPHWSAGRSTRTRIRRPSSRRSGTGARTTSACSTRCLRTEARGRSGAEIAAARRGHAATLGPSRPRRRHPTLLPSARRQPEPTVDHQGDPADERREIRAEVERRPRDVVDRPEAAQRGHLHHAVLRRPDEQAPHTLGIGDRPGRDAVDADAVLPPLDGKDAGQGVDARLGGRDVELRGQCRSSAAWR